MNTIQLNITKMTCEHCATSAQNALNALDGITATVSFDEQLATIHSENKIDSEQLIKTVEDSGYGATKVNNEQQHIAIIGTGSGAFAAAIKAVEKGARVTIIEGADVIGGTCVNIGCVPSKIMIRGAHIAHLQQHHNIDGVALTTPKINRKAMVKQQQQWVANLRHAKYEHILETNPNINLVRGMAHFKNDNTLEIKQKNNAVKTLTADRFLIAVGARAMIPAIEGLKSTPFWTSTEALIAGTLPKHLVVIGGSVVAIELAQAFHHLGSKVTLIARSSLLSKMDDSLSDTLKNILVDEGMNVILNTVPNKVNHDGKNYTVSFNNQTIQCDQLLVATGRQSNADTLSLNNADVKQDASGNIIIDEQMQTTVKTIYAAGDCTNQPQFVYVAAAAGTRAARNMTGEHIKIDLTVVPSVVFCNPQVASVGMTEKQANDSGIKTISRELALENVPRAIANMDTRGVIKLIAEEKSGLILGCQIIAGEAGEVIQTASLAINNKMTIDDLAGQLFPYLTMVEGLKLTAQTFNKDVSQLSCCAG